MKDGFNQKPNNVNVQVCGKFNRYHNIAIGMGNKVSKLVNGFSDTLVKDWENSDGVNFAIALARITDWLLHVDWWSPYDDAPLHEMRSLRVYVGIDENIVFDFQGKKRIQAFTEYVIMPIAEKRAYKRHGGILTRYYSEATLKTLPLRIRANEAYIKKAEIEILKNKAFIEKIPQRLNPRVPADRAAQFSFGWCAPFAAALEKVKGLTAVGIVAVKYSADQSNTPGYFHSVVLHPDGGVEDSWGKQPLQRVLDRFGVVEYILSRDEHLEKNARLMKNSPEKYADAYKEALSYLVV